MPYCKKCGTLLDDDALFCHECGTTVVRTKSSQSNIDDKDKTIRLNHPVYGTVDLNELPAGYLIDERYEVKEKLGQGGFGTVYRAYDHKMDIDKALKVIPEVVYNDVKAMQILEKEAKLMIMLNHPNIVRFYDFHDSGNIKFIDMEYVEGKTLNGLLMEYPSQNMPEVTVKVIALQLIDAMIYAHDMGVIHRDLKPQNIMFTFEGRIKIMDFGIAETLRNSVSRLRHTTSSGTLFYMSPEQVEGDLIGKESDIYSFGATLYELLSGNPPFYKGEIIYQILNKQITEIKDVSLVMNIFLKKCLAKKIEDRFKSFYEVKEALEPILGV